MHTWPGCRLLALSISPVSSACHARFARDCGWCMVYVQLQHKNLPPPYSSCRSWESYLHANITQSVKGGLFFFFFFSDFGQDILFPYRTFFSNDFTYLLITLPWWYVRKIRGEGKHEHCYLQHQSLLTRACDNNTASTTPLLPDRRGIGIYI